MLTPLQAAWSLPALAGHIHLSLRQLAQYSVGGGRLAEMQQLVRVLIRLAQAASPEMPGWGAVQLCNCRGGEGHS